MMKGAKRFAVSDSAPDTNDSALRNKRIMGGSLFDAQRAKTSQQQSTATPPLDPQRAESSQQHVRALNTQFASWVQLQLKNHPDELWEDGVQDYLAHASKIMEKFSDVVNWLKANAVKGGSPSTAENCSNENKLIPETKNNETKLFQGKAGFTPGGLIGSSSTAMFNNFTPGGTSLGNASGGTNMGFTSGSTTSSSTGCVTTGFSASNTTTSFASGSATMGFSSGNATTSFTSGSVPMGFSFGGTTTNFTSGSAPMGFSLGSSTTSFTSGITTASFAPAGMSTSFATSWSSGVFSNNQTPISFGSQSSAPVDNNASGHDDDEDELPRPSSPSVKKSEEKGIVVVHEVKCKLYVKSTDPEDKDSWKDKGTGQLSIKCKEGVSKGSKESKPIILVRNDVGKVLLNALLYPGIKTSAQKNSLVAIFHTSDDDGMNVVARTFLIRTRTEEERNKLATAIQEYAPES